MSLHGVIFDFDGVIANTEPLHLEAYQQVLADTPLSLDSRAYYTQYLGYDDIGVFTTLAKNQGVALSRAQLEQWIAQKHERFNTLVGGEPAIFPGATTCIEQLAAVAPLGIASGALHTEIEAILSRASLRHYFRAIVAADDVEHPKPSPDAYLRAVDLINGPQNNQTARSFVAIEDSRWGVESAQAAGLICVAVTHSYPAEELRAADLVVHHLAEVRPDRLELLRASLDQSDRPVR